MYVVCILFRTGVVVVLTPAPVIDDVRLAPPKKKICLPEGRGLQPDYIHTSRLANLNIGIESARAGLDGSSRHLITE